MLREKPKEYHCEVTSLTVIVSDICVVFFISHVIIKESIHQSNIL